MKKNGFGVSMLTIMMVALLTIGFASCNRDDDDNFNDDNSSSSSVSLVGTWTCTEDSWAVYTYIFKSDGTGQCTRRKTSGTLEWDYKFRYTLLSATKGNGVMSGRIQETVTSANASGWDINVGQVYTMDYSVSSSSLYIGGQNFHK